MDSIRHPSVADHHKLIIEIAKAAPTLFVPICKALTPHQFDNVILNGLSGAEFSRPWLVA